MYRIPLSERQQLTAADVEALTQLRRSCAADIARMTWLATCGHPGGSLSTLDALLLLYSSANLDPKQPRGEDRDRVIISHGHISPGVYSVLSAWGFVDRIEALTRFRLAGSAFSGHVEFAVPGVEWNTGNLGQGLSAGAASALAARLRGKSSRAVVLMGDGEQQKGQIAEARRFAVKYKLNNLIAIVDYNGLQIGGECRKIMPQDIAADYRAAAWNVIEVDGHDLPALYQAWRKAYLSEVDKPEHPTLLLARSTMGKGISYMEGDAHFHGVAPNLEQCRKALQELGAEDDLDALSEARKALGQLVPRSMHHGADLATISQGEARTYEAGTNVDCRSGYGNALADLGQANNSGAVPKVLALTCDLEGSVKMNAFHKSCPQAFFEVGIQEHHAATLTGRLSWEGFTPFFSTFGVFAVAEGYNQQRLNDINETNVKIVSTHCGLDVGEDGPTHQSIDWIALMSSPFGFRVFSPADANQCDRMIRYAASSPGNIFIAMGRSKVPVITNEAGEPFYAGSYAFEDGKADWLRGGDDAVIACFGPTVYRALEARELLLSQGKSVAVVNFGSLKPIDAESIVRASKTGAIVSVEDHAVHCGLGALIAQELGARGLACKLSRLGVSRYGSSGHPDALFAEQGMAPSDIAHAVLDLLA